MGNVLEKAMGHILGIHLPISCGHDCQCAQPKTRAAVHVIFSVILRFVRSYVRCGEVYVCACAASARLMKRWRLEGGGGGGGEAEARDSLFGFSRIHNRASSGIAVETLYPAPEGVELISARARFSSLFGKRSLIIAKAGIKALNV